MRIGFFQIVFFIFGLSIMFAAVYGAFRMWKSNPRTTETRTIKTSGEVIALKPVRRWTVAPQVRFLASDGRVVTFVDKIEVNISIPTYKIGQTVSVLYQPDKPENARVRDASVGGEHGGGNLPLSFMPFLFLVIGTGFTLVATFSREPGNVSIFDYVHVAAVSSRNYVYRMADRLVNKDFAMPDMVHVYRMAGHWANEDTGWANEGTAMPDIIRIQIDTDWPRVRATMWRKCQLEDCTPGRYETPSGSSEISWSTSNSYIHESVFNETLHLDWMQSASAMGTQRMQLRPDGRLEVETTTGLTDQSGSREFSRTDYFRRQ